MDMKPEQDQATADAANTVLSAEQALSELWRRVEVSSLANGNILVAPVWKGVRQYTPGDGGGPGLFSRMSAAKLLESLITAAIQTGKAQEAASRSRDGMSMNDLIQRLRDCATDWPSTTVSAGGLMDEAATALESQQARIRTLEEALQQAQDHLYNPFEPDNQSNAYKAVCKALSQE